MRSAPFRPLLGLAFVAVASFSAAAVTTYDIFPALRYTQTSASAPTTLTSADFSARVFTDADDDAITWTVNTPNGPQALTQPTQPTLDHRSIQFRQDFSTADPQGDLDAAYPSGTYDFSIDTGNRAGETGSIDVPNADRPNEVPYLNGGSFAALQNVTAGQSVNVTWGSYTLPDPTAPDLQSIYFAVFDFAGGTLVEANGANGTYGGQTISGLQAGHTYGYVLTYSPRFVVANAGFGSAASTVGFDSATSGQFTVQSVPEPAPFALLGLGALAAIRRRRGKARGIGSKA